MVLSKTYYGVLLKLKLLTSKGKLKSEKKKTKNLSGENVTD